MFILKHEWRSLQCAVISHFGPRSIRGLALSKFGVWDLCSFNKFCLCRTCQNNDRRTSDRPAWLQGWLWEFIHHCCALLLIDGDFSQRDGRLASWWSILAFQWRHIKGDCATQDPLAVLCRTRWKVIVIQLSAFYGKIGHYSLEFKRLTPSELFFFKSKPIAPNSEKVRSCRLTVLNLQIYFHRTIRK